MTHTDQSSKKASTTPAMIPQISRRRTLISGFSSLAVVITGDSAWGGGPSRCTNLSLTQITAGVWIHSSWGELANGLCAPSNGMVIMGEDRIFLTNTAWTPEQTKELLDLLRPMANKSDLIAPRRLINLFVSHDHIGRTGGLRVTASRGISSYAFMRTLIESARHDKGAITFALPNDRFAFDLGGRVVEVFYPGPGYTVDNAVVYDRESKTLFGGCLIRALTTNSLDNSADFDTYQWNRSIERTIHRYPDVQIIVPEDGEPGGKELFLHTQKLMDAHIANT
ncbi:MAG: hypothetical protein CMG46_06695 [Candidatus Marinimicrobia bacterium]|nr:hypothetical protein [Candidatus Neomarinimicrobiota bacterium]